MLILMRIEVPEPHSSLCGLHCCYALVGWQVILYLHYECLFVGDAAEVILTMSGNGLETTLSRILYFEND